MDILEIANKINKAGGTLYLVGGAVRDEFIALFPEAHIRGKSFEVYDIDGKEFALARVERKTGIGHKEFDVETNKNITIEEDLKRRDITINSIAKNVLTSEYVDPFNGRKDIKNRIIRATSDAFIEDPLRVYRVARFAAQLEFEVEDNTIKLMNSLKNELNALSKERVFCEFRRALEQNNPSIFFNVLRKANVLDIHFKEVADLINVEQPYKYHPEGDAYNHTMIVLDDICKNTNDVIIRFCGLVHDFGKGITPRENYPHHYGHDVNGVAIVRQFGKKLKVPNNWMKCGITAAKEHMKGGIFDQMTTKKQVQFIERIDKSLLGLEGLQYVVDSDKGTRG